MSAAFFRGTQIDQNVKFKDKDKQLMNETKYPSEFNQKVDLSKVSEFAFKELCLNSGGIAKVYLFPCRSILT